MLNQWDTLLRFTTARKVTLPQSASSGKCDCITETVSWIFLELQEYKAFFLISYHILLPLQFNEELLQLHAEPKSPSKHKTMLENCIAAGSSV